MGMTMGKEGNNAAGEESVKSFSRNCAFIIYIYLYPYGSTKGSQRIVTVKVSAHCFVEKALLMSGFRGQNVRTGERPKK